MSRSFQISLIGITLLYLPALSSPTNWFLDAPRAIFGLAGTASASASASPSPASYILDLRKKQEKSNQLTNDKYVMEDANFPHGTGQEKEGSGKENDDEELNNEASPSLLEKKVGKILTKLRLIAQIKNAYHYRPEIYDHDTNITFTSQENRTSISINPTESKEPPEEGAVKEPEYIKPQTTKNIHTIQSSGGGSDQTPIDVKNAGEPDDAPTKIELDVNVFDDKLEKIDQKKNAEFKEQEQGRFGSLGLFFAELLGSIVGLTYGAIAQLTSGGQSPVTVSTYENI